MEDDSPYPLSLSLFYTHTLSSFSFLLLFLSPPEEHALESNAVLESQRLEVSFFTEVSSKLVLEHQAELQALVRKYSREHSRSGDQVRWRLGYYDHELVKDRLALLTNPLFISSLSISLYFSLLSLYLSLVFSLFLSSIFSLSLFSSAGAFLYAA